MGIGIGGQTVIGTAEESTYGTAVVVDRFYEFLTEGIERRHNIVQSNAIRGGQAVMHTRRGSRQRVASRDAGGPLRVEVNRATMGRWFKHLMGGTPTFVQQGGTAAYLHTYAMGSQLGKYLTIQKQIRDSANAEVESFTEVGCKLISGEFSIAPDGNLEMGLGVDARDEVTNIAMASPSFANTDPFTYSEGALRLAGVTATQVTNATITINRALRSDDRKLGSGGLKGEPVENDFPTITGSITADFDAPATIYDRFAANTALPLVLEFVGATAIASTYFPTFRITIPEVRFRGETPKVTGPDVVTISGNFEGYWDGSAADVTLEYMTTDLSA